MNPEEISRYEAAQRRKEMAWKSQSERVLQSDRAAVDIGLVAIRTAVLTNAGAIVSLLAFVGQLWNDDDATIKLVLSGVFPFVVGLICAALCAGVACFYQSFNTGASERVLKRILQEAEVVSGTKWVVHARLWSAIVMSVLGTASYIAFVWGTITIANVLAL